MNGLEEATCWELLQELVGRPTFDGLIIFDSGSMPDCENPPAVKMVMPLGMKGVRVNQFLVALIKTLEINFQKWEEEKHGSQTEY